MIEMIIFAKNNNIIKFKCLIISTIFIASMFLSSCATPRSVRPTGSYLSSQKSYIIKPFKEPENNKNANTNKQKYYTVEQAKSNNHGRAIAGLNNTNLDNNGLPIKKIPSLNEQMKLLYETNLKMQKDIEIIKKSINKINQQIDNIDNQNNRKPISAQQNISNKPLQNKRVRNNPTPKGNDIILSDQDNQKLEKINFDDKIQNTITKKPFKFKSNSKHKPKKKNAKKIKESSQNLPSKIKIKPIDDIKNVQSIINSKDYQAAIRKLTDLINKTKDPVKLTICNFYLGESHFGLKQFGKAIEYFKIVLNNGNSDKNDLAQFNIAQALFKLGDIPKAKKEYSIFVKKYPKSVKIPEARKILQQI